MTRMARRGGRRKAEQGPSVRVVAAEGGRRRMLVDGLEASVVDRADPTHLDFPYMRWIADVLDVGWRAGTPLRAVHVGAGGCVLPRYLAATRPGSDSEAYEVDELIKSITTLKVLAFIINVAVAVYLLYAKRLFGLRGGARADEEIRARDVGWGALERSVPGATAG